MREPEVTLDKILQNSGALFNTQGYKATSLSDITQATGLTKGAIYRHFKSKEELERRSLTYLSGILYHKMRDVIRGQPDAVSKLKAVFSFFSAYISDPPIKGGCPLLNAAVESDDTDSELKHGALGILNTLKQSIVSILENGVKHGQIRPDIDKGFYATVIIASLEGAIMMSKLDGNNRDICIVIRHLEKLIEEIKT
jgi:TetR/AcrR family transcriptional regulator, transcriptional repressor for nem operon